MKPEKIKPIPKYIQKLIYKEGRVIFIDSSYPKKVNASESTLVKFGGEYLCS